MSLNLGLGIFSAIFSAFLVLHLKLHFYCKNFDFFEIYDLSARTKEKGVEPVRTICGQGRGVNFLRLCADVFYGRP